MQSGKYYGYERGRPDEAESTRLLTLSQCVSGASECLKRGVSPVGFPEQDSGAQRPNDLERPPPVSTRTRGALEALWWLREKPSKALWGSFHSSE
jgi:hypothetical protein